MEFNQHIAFINSIVNSTAVISYKCRNLAISVVCTTNRTDKTVLHHNDFCGIKGNFCTVRICSHKSASAKQNTAEVAGNNNTYIINFIFYNYIKARHTGCTRGFTVIAVTLYVALTQRIGIDIVSCVPMFTAFFVDKINSLLLTGYRLAIADKA